MPNWVFLAVPMAVLVIVYAIYAAVLAHREQAYLHAIYDGDRIQQWKSDRRNRKRNRKWFSARRERIFY